MLGGAVQGSSTSSSRPTSTGRSRPQFPAPEDSASGGARERHPHRRRRHLGERRDARGRIERDGRRLQRPAERRGACRRRARGRRDPHLRRDLPADRGDREGACRHVEACLDGGNARRGRGAAAVRVSRLRRSQESHVTSGVIRRGRGCGSRARRGRPGELDLAAQALQGRRARGRRGLRVRHPPRRLQRREGRRHPRGLQCARSSAPICPPLRRHRQQRSRPAPWAPAAMWASSRSSFTSPRPGR